MLGFVIFVAAAVIALLEASRHAYASREEWRREARISLILGAAALLVEALLPTRAAPPSPAVGVTIAIAVFLADDLLYYVSHRLAHRVAVFWASHAVHHSPCRCNLLTGLRQPPTWLLTPAAAAPLLLLSWGAPTGVVAACAGVRGLHHFLIHTERVRRLPAWVEFVFNTPSHHRVHHAVEPGCLDRNFGGVLIVWDRLFATFAAEPGGSVSRYGLVHPTGPSAWRTVLDPWASLYARLRAAPTVRAKVSAALGPPELDG